MHSEVLSVLIDVAQLDLSTVGAYLMSTLNSLYFFFKSPRSWKILAVTKEAS